jgi:hypothetical protein
MTITTRYLRGAEMPPVFWYNPMIAIIERVFRDVYLSRRSHPKVDVDELVPLFAMSTEAVVIS